MKECFKCKKMKSLDEFYAHPMMADGHLNKCKSCTRSDSEKRRKILEKDPGWVLMERRRHREKAKRQRAEGRCSTKNNKEKNLYASKHPLKRKARSAVQTALKSGSLHRHPCCICGNKAEAHHEDYSKPLEVIWLCPKHHGEHHHKKRDQEIMKKLTNQ